VFRHRSCLLPSSVLHRSVACRWKLPWTPPRRTIWIAPAHRRRAKRDVPTKKAAPAWSNEPEPGHNRGDDLPADDTQLPSVGVSIQK
jgi:hypothetical protein